MDTWSLVAMPVLSWLSAHEGDHAQIGQIADHLGLDPQAVANELDRLCRAGYVAGEVRKSATGGNPRPWSLFPIRLEERGARAIGLWPSGDSGEVLLDVLKRAEATETDPERKSRLQKAVEAIGGLAHDLVVDLGVSIVKSYAGLP